MAVVRPSLPLAMLVLVAAAASPGGAVAAGAAPSGAVSPAPAAAAAPRVEFFSPEGSATGVRQVSVRFSEPMVALGDLRLPTPFAIDCPATGAGRWADPKNWVYDFAADLPAGLVCRFRLRPGLASAAGRALGGRRAFRFDTGGPTIVGTLPYEGSPVDEDQIFLAKLNAVATPASVAAHAHCVVDGIGERIGVVVLQGEERAKFLANRAALGYSYYSLLWKDGSEDGVRVRDRSFEQADAALVAFRCERRLPPATKMQVVWGRGIAAATGIATARDQKLAFRVRPAFTAQVQCSRTNARAGCIPSLPVTVQFSAPVPVELAAQVRLSGTEGAIAGPKLDAKQTPTVEELSFAGPFPERSTVRVTLPAALHDDAGRPLANAARFPLELRIDAYPPLAKFAATFGILEAAEGGVLPVTLRNVEPALAARRVALPARSLKLASDPATVATWLKRVEKANEGRGEWVDIPESQRTAPPPRASSDAGADDEENEAPTSRWREDTGTRSVFADGAQRATSFTLDKPAGDRPAEVVGIPLGDPGFYVVEIESRRLGQALLGRDQVRYVTSAALVTNLSVHIKWGRESSRVWVTRLADGKPAAGADIQIDGWCSGRTLWTGRTDAQGVASVESTLGEPDGSSYCGSRRGEPLFVSAKLGGDFSFALSSWADGIAPYSFSMPVGDGEDAADIFHTVLDRSLFRAGETVSMKHVLRRHTQAGMVVAGGLPAKRTVVITHLGSGQHYELDAAFGADGIATGEWKIPQEAKLGEYTIEIGAGDGVRYLPAGRFQVQQFRLPSMRASLSGPAEAVVRPSSVALDLHVAYLSGGGAGGLPVKVRTAVQPRTLSFAEYEDYTFGGAPVREGVDVDANAPALDFEAPPQPDDTKVQVLPVTLDAAGSARVTIGNLSATDAPALLTAELEYPDANGQLLSTTARVRLAPSDLTLGIRREGWVASAKQMRFRVVALDTAGRARAGVPVAVALYQSTSYSYRRRLIGGFYAYESSRETKKLAATCAGRTDAQGLIACQVAPGASGEVIVRAEARDAGGRVSGATTSIWVAGDDDWWFGGTAGDRMDLLPEKPEYSAGETARFQVRMPFRSATALVTVEREGVLTSFVTKLEGRAPVVEVPIAANYAPNVYVSVLAVRGRVAGGARGKRGDGADITALVDLRKPAYRLGMARIRVGWQPHRLDVRVVAGREVYRVRERANVTVHVTRADGSALPAGTELAFAAVDEALLDLAPNRSWGLLDAMMGERGLEVWTSTAQMQVVGKRHYGRKAVPHGGGGGREQDRGRELFDSLLTWQPRVKLDAAGDAQLSVPLNDSLTAFRIVAVASGGAQWFGTGSTTVRTTQDLILVSGVPPVVREGDRFAATFTVRNASERSITAELAPTQIAVGAERGLTAAQAKAQVLAEAKLAEARASTTLSHERVTLSPGQARDVVWQVRVPYGATKLSWKLVAREIGGSASDTLSVASEVRTAVPVRTYMATLAQLDPAAPLTMPAALPAGAVPGRGGLELTLRAKLGDGLDGVREYMSLYPYICLEQNLSRAVALRDQTLWSTWMDRLPAYMDGDGLLRYFPTDRLQGDDTLTAYVLALAHEAGWAVPDAERERLVQALTAFVRGKLKRGSALPTADLSIRRLAAIDALSRYDAATPDMLDSLDLDPALLPTSAVLDWLGVLDRVPNVPRAQARRQAALGILRSRLNFQGTTMGFSTERSDALWWLMISSDSNANRMLLAVLDRPEWREDVGRLVRGALGRQQRGHWNTTVANAWGVLAMEKFSAAFESVPVTGTSNVTYGPTTRAVPWTAKQPVNELALPWAAAPAPLSISHAGTGRPWAMVRATAALPLAKPLSSGYRITRTVTPVEQQVPGRWSRGDTLRVRLDLDAQSDMSWVVIYDPVPAGASILGSGLGGESALAQRGETAAGFGWLAYEERRFDAYRAYYRFVPKGALRVEYTIRLENPGTFQLPTTRVEAMYAPEMFGELPNAPLVVAPPP